jgi:predicted glutamine amidotransferase
MPPVTQVAIDVVTYEGAPPDADDRALAAGELIRVLDETGVAADRPDPTTSPGDRSVELTGAVVALLTSGTVLPAVVQTLQTWVTRREAKVRIHIGDDEIELSAATSTQQEALVAAFLRRHGETDGEP